jgi:SAM-dependent methyltransferase
MPNALKLIERRIVKRWLRRLKRWRHVRYGDINVHYKDHLDGGGRTSGLEYLPLFRDLNLPRQRRVFEWCAGPGFIGFALLGYGFCDTLCVADINPEAIEACRRTVAANALGEKVTIYLSDNLDHIAPSEQWDLVVGNPPHFVDQSPGELRFHDEGWNLHRRFFTTVGRFLKPGGVIVLLENNAGSTAETFRDMIDEADFSILFVHGCEGRRTPYPRIYYIALARKGETPAVWAGVGKRRGARAPLGDAQPPRT